jgi:nitrogen regulatory protein PII
LIFHRHYNVWSREMNMKEIKTVILQSMATKLVDALNKIPHFPGLTMTKVQGFGKEKARITGSWKI